MQSRTCIKLFLNGQWHCQNQFHCLMSTVRWVRLRLRLRQSTTPRKDQRNAEFHLVAQQSDEHRVSQRHILRPQPYIFIYTLKNKGRNDRMREILLYLYFEMRILPLVHVFYYFNAVVRDMRVLAPLDRSACVRYESETETETIWASNAFNSINASTNSNEDFIGIVEI